ncbi:MAG: RNase adaptor protein RapZ, partial [Proteobacteria bacterium]|nr:RNase adaptor protein RapZ [Pseudomonadota bacterium]
MGAATRVVLVTGLSGAGKSSALKDLEDLGYEAIDNVPLALVPNLFEPVSPDGDGSPPAALDIGVDSRTRLFNAKAFDSVLTRLRRRVGLEPILLFLDATDDVLRRRFTETRRRHPMAVDRPVQDGIDAERVLMAAVRDRADFLVDTSDLSSHDLRRLLGKQFKR